jgi:membrane-associated phospholipid phosphatase
MNRESQPLWKSFCLTTAGTLALVPSFILWCDLVFTNWASARSPRMAWRLFSRLGDGWLYAATYLWMREMDQRPLAGRVAASVLLAWGLGSALKILVRRKRRNPRIFKKRAAFLNRWNGWSFPSQHAAVTVAFAAALWPNPAAAALAVCVCCSRVLIGAHYLGDVLAGIAVGLVAGRLA